MSTDLELSELFYSRSRRPKRTATAAAPSVAISGETVTGETVTGDLATNKPAAHNRTTDQVPVQTPRPARRGIGRPPSRAGERWEDRVRRAAYYLDVTLLDELTAYCVRTGTNKSEVVRDALAAHLRKKG